MTPTPAAETLCPDRILTLVPNWVGDVAMCTPALRALRRRFPHATLEVAGKASACALLEGLPYIDRYHVLPSRMTVSETMRMGGVLRAAGPGLAVIFPHSFRAALLARLSAASCRIGYARGGRSLLLTHAVPPHRKEGRIVPVYMSREYLELVARLGCEDDDGGLELRASQEALDRVESCFSKSGPRVGIAPGAAFGPSKMWPAERYARVADALVERMHAQVVLLTGPGEERTRRDVLNAAQQPLLTCDGGKPTIDTLKATISKLDLLICNDSGARHVAVAFGVPVICIMGPTSPAYSTGPYEKGQVLRVDVDCGPCQKPICRTDHQCMTRITVERVMETALTLLRR